jgi:hypothetical protein
VFLTNLPEERARSGGPRLLSATTEFRAARLGSALSGLPYEELMTKQIVIVAVRESE